MKKLFMFIFFVILVVPVFSQPNPPTNFKAIGCNGYVKLTWTNPLGSYDGIYIYRNEIKIAEVNNGDPYYEVSETPHSEINYYLKSWVDNWDEVPPENTPLKQSEEKIIKPDGRIITLSAKTTTFPQYAVKCWFLGPQGSQGDGSSWTKVINGQTVSNIKDYTTFNYVVSDYYGGDTIYFAYANGNSYNLGTTAINFGNTEPLQVDASNKKQLVFASGHIHKQGGTNRIIISTSSGDAFVTDGSDWINILGFQFNGLASGDWCIVANKSSNLIIRDNYFNFSSGTGCVKMQSGNDETEDILNNYIEYNTVLQGTDGGDVWGSNGDFIQIGLEADASLGNIDDIHIRYNNIIFSNSYSGTNPWHTDMVQLYRLKNDATINIYNNYFEWNGSRSDKGTQGIHATSIFGEYSANIPGGRAEINIWNNIFNFQNSGKIVNVNNHVPEYDTNGVIIGYWNPSYIVVNFYNNSTYVGALNSYNSSLFLIQRPCSTALGKNKMKNNIFYLADTDNNVNCWEFTEVNTSDFSAADFTDNLFYVDGLNSSTTCLKWGNNDLNLSQAQGFGIEAGSEYGNPGYHSISNGDFTINNSCNNLVVDAGTNLNSTNPPLVSWTNDYDDHERGTNWDRGAYDGHYWQICKESDYIFTEFFLKQNYPNPFNPVTKIKFTIPKNGNVSLIIYDELGREIIKLFEGQKSKGEYSLDFDASNLSSGIYFYKLGIDDLVEIKKMVLLK
ncbi:MAG: T9SS type A sorting domain-containing protein [Syntrophothermus sp.]